MLRNILAISTNIAVALHAALGCCLHHTHAHVGNSHSNVAAHEAAHPCHHHHHHKSSPAPTVDRRHSFDQQQQHPHHHHCVDLHCSVVLVKRKSETTTRSLLDAMSVVLRDHRHSLIGEVLSRTLWRYGNSHHLTAHAPLRAQSQVWLL